jgi:ribonuclease P protein component
MHAQHRLSATADFEAARKRGRSWGNALLVLHVVRVPEGPTRCGFSVSRRVGNAVARNRVRRRLREIVRCRLTAVAPGWHLVLTARPATVAAPYRALLQSVDELFRRAGLLPVDELL